MDIENLGSETIEQFYKEVAGKKYCRFYVLTKEQLVPLKELLEKSAQNIINGIEKSKQIKFERVLYGMAKALVKQLQRNWWLNFNSIEVLKNASLEELVQVEDIGQKIAESLIEFFQKRKFTDYREVKILWNSV